MMNLSLRDPYTDIIRLGSFPFIFLKLEARFVCINK